MYQKTNISGFTGLKIIKQI